MDTFWATLLGSAIGVVAGVFVQFMCQKALNWFADKRIRSNLIQECEFNLHVASEFKSALSSFRNAVNGDALQHHFPYAPLDRGLHIQINNLVAAGRLHDFCKPADLQRVQRVTQLLSAHQGQWFTQQLDNRKAAAVAAPLEFDKPEAVGFLNWCDARAADLERDLTELKGAFR